LINNEGDTAYSQLKATYDNYNTANQLVRERSTNVKSFRQIPTETVHALMDVGFRTKQKKIKTYLQTTKLLHIQNIVSHPGMLVKMCVHSS